MINKFYKRIQHNYARLFKFIFFLRYLFVIFFIASVAFLTVPFFFDYEKRAGLIKGHLIENYNYKINKYDKIQFRALPTPRFEFKNASINFVPSSIKLNVQNLKIYPKFLSIYNFENFKSRKIELQDNKVFLKASNLNFFIKNFFNQKNKLSIDNLNINISNKNNSIINFKKIVFSNFGYNKNLIKGEVFDKKFKVKTSNDLKNINFKLINSGITAEIDFDNQDKSDLVKGVFKTKILNTNFKSNFSYDNKVINIFNSYFRSKNLSFNINSIITINPFLNTISKFKIEDIDANIFYKLNLEKLLKTKEILKKINSKNEINFISKKFSRNPIDELNLKIDLAYGRLNYSKKISISDSFLRCEGNLNLLEEFPLLFFDCFITTDNQEALFKKFSLKLKDKKKFLKLNVKGNINILNNKINFKKILMNENYKATNEDLTYFKEVFENIVFDENFLEIFNLKKIKNFLLEIS